MSKKLIIVILTTMLLFVDCTRQSSQTPTPSLPPAIVPSSEPTPTPIPAPAPPMLIPTPTTTSTPSPTTPAPTLVGQGPPRHQTPHFAIWADPDALDDNELAQVADLLEKDFGQVTSFLAIDYDIVQKGKIPVYFRSTAGLSFTTPEGAIVFSGYKETLKVAPQG